MPDEALALADAIPGAINIPPALLDERPLIRHPDEYAGAVLDGAIPMGPSVRAACARHQKDRKRSDIFLDEERLAQIFGFAECLTVTRPKRGTLRLLPHQVFQIGSLLGWRKNTRDAPRRFRYGFIETGKGSGKSPTTAVLSLWSLIFENDIAPENYFVASTLKQGRIAFKDFVSFILLSPEVSQVMKVLGGSTPHRVVFRQPGILGSAELVADSPDEFSGARPHLSVIDEYHAFESDGMLREFEAGAKTNENALVVVATNSGVIETTPCGRAHHRAILVARGEFEADHEFSFVCDLDPGDDRRDPRNWIKTNPGLPDFPGYNYIASRISKADTDATVAADVDRQQFCIWNTGDYHGWISPSEIMAVMTPRTDPAISPPEDRAGRPCWLGVDLARTEDFTAIAAVWDMGDGRFEAQIEMWTPHGLLTEKSKEVGGDHIRAHVEAGYLRATPGKSIAHDEVAVWLRDFLEANEVRAAAVDDWRWNDLIKGSLDKMAIPTHREPGYSGLFIVSHPPTHGRNMSPRRAAQLGLPLLWMPRSVEVLTDLIRERKIRIRYNPLVLGAVRGIIMKSDDAGYLRPTKTKSRVRIDSLVALFMACGIADAMKRAEAPEPDDSLWIEAQAAL